MRAQLPTSTAAEETPTDHEAAVAVQIPCGLLRYGLGMTSGPQRYGLGVTSGLLRYGLEMTRGRSGEDERPTALELGMTNHPPPPLFPQPAAKTAADFSASHTTP